MKKTITSNPNIPASTRLLLVFVVIIAFVVLLYGENLQGLTVIGYTDDGCGWQQN